MKLANFILPVPSQPRFSKRIEAFKTNGYKVKVFSYEREYFKGKVKENDFISLGKISHKQYFKRIFVLLRSLLILQIYRREFTTCKVVYTFGFDVALITLIWLKINGIRNCKIVYEVGDIQEVLLQKNIKGKVLRFVEKTIINNINYLVVTSPKFAREYYIKKLNITSDKIIVLENKLMPPIPKEVKKNLWDGTSPLVIGLFGLIRCKISWDLLLKLAQKFPDKIIVYIRGYVLGIEHFKEDVEKYKNIIYEGEYINPDDLSEIYSKIHISWIGNVIKDSDSTRWALPNRYYESLYYKVPMISHKNTSVSERVEEKNVGWSLDFNNFEEVSRFFSDFSREDYIAVMKSFDNLKDEDIIGVYDHQRMVDKLMN
jgi:succinoglycan biosynthesis protein ExoL